MHTDVLIVGAGPAGLVLAAVLAEHGVNFRIVDRKAAPVAESRATIVHVRTLELLHRLGLASRFVAQGVPTTSVEIGARGRVVGAFPLAGRGVEALTPFPHALGLEQDRIEQLLVDWLAEHGSTVDWNTELVTLTSGPERTQAQVRRGAGQEETISARWVVGADGARSAVRHAQDVRFTGSTYAQTGLLADVDLDQRSGPVLPPGTLRLNLTRGGFVGVFRLANGRHRIFGAVPPGLTPPDAAGDVTHEAYATVPLTQIQDWFDRYFAIDTTVTDAAWTALFRIHSRIADRFRAGHVFLVGDAAHIHSPAGGQGMNLAIGDAFNLGWKLALVATGRARSELLDSYEAERRAVAATVLRGTDRGFTWETTRNPIAAWARTHLAARLTGPLTRIPAIRARVFRLFSQTWIGYRDSPAVAGIRKRPYPGDRAPHGALHPTKDGAPHDLYDIIGGIRHHALLFRTTPTQQRLVNELLRQYAMDIAVHAIPHHEQALHFRYNAHTPRLFLIRPDGHLEFSGQPDRLNQLAAFLDTNYLRRSSTGDHPARRHH